MAFVWHIGRSTWRAPVCSMSSIQPTNTTWVTSIPLFSIVNISLEIFKDIFWLWNQIFSIAATSGYKYLNSRSRKRLPRISLNSFMEVGSDFSILQWTLSTGFLCSNRFSWNSYQSLNWSLYFIFEIKKTPSQWLPSWGSSQWRNCSD